MLIQAHMVGEMDGRFQPEFRLAIGARYMHVDARFFS